MRDRVSIYEKGYIEKSTDIIANRLF